MLVIDDHILIEVVDPGTVGPSASANAASQSLPTSGRKPNRSSTTGRAT
jgi:hypothetical protein